MHAPELVERLVHDISAAFDSSIVPAEVRASFDSASSVELEWLFDSFSELGLDYETIESLDGIDFERFTGAGLIWGTERLLTFRRDDNDETVLFFDYYQPGEKIPWQHAIESIKLDLNDRVIRFYERQHEAYAVIPGMESHWFFSPIWKNRRFLFQSALAALLTNLFALGTSMFSMVVYNKIIPANAMSSLTVLVIGMFILILTDYAVKVSRSKFLGVVGIDAGGFFSLVVVAPDAGWKTASLSKREPSASSSPRVETLAWELSEEKTPSSGKTRCLNSPPRCWGVKIASSSPSPGNEDVTRTSFINARRVAF